MISFEGRSVVVIGGTGNLGRAVIRRFLEAGAYVAAAARDPARGDALRAALGPLASGERSARLLIFEADPADGAAMARMVETVLRTWGRLDVLANLAGGYASGPATDLELIESVWRQNTLVPITAAAACLVPMRARGRGRIVSVAAQAALRGGPNGAAYAMAKSALIRWTESLAAEVRDVGITVNAVLPSTIDSPENRARAPKAEPKKWATPDEVAAAILFLASDEASGITGSSLAVSARV